MPVFLIERNYAEQLEIVEGAAATINQINADAGVQWLISFLSADRRKTYCLYEAPNAEAIRLAAQRAGIPADSIIEVTEAQSSGKLGEVNLARFVAM